MLSRSDPELFGNLRADRRLGRFVVDLLAVDGRPLARLPGHAQLARHLSELGLAAIGYTRVKEARGSDDGLALALRDAYLYHSLCARLFRAATGEALQRLESAGIPHVLFKGACMAQLYTDPAHRPYGDIDLFVPQHHRKRAELLLAERRASSQPIQADLDQDLGQLGLPDFDLLHARSVTRALAGTCARTLDDTDTLSVACLHLAKHGCERPIWLHDIALLAVQREANALDFERIKRLPDYQLRWVATVLVVAEQLLGARLPARWHGWAIENAEHAERVAAAFVAHWSRVPETRRLSSGALAANPRSWLRAARDRWPEAEQLRYAAKHRPAEPVLARQTVQFVRAAASALPRLALGRLR